MVEKIEENPSYSLVEFPGKLGQEVRLRSTGRYAFTELTPYGAAALARQLLHWAVGQDSDLAKRYPGFIVELP